MDWDDKDGNEANITGAIAHRITFSNQNELQNYNSIKEYLKKCTSTILFKIYVQNNPVLM